MTLEVIKQVLKENIFNAEGDETITMTDASLSQLKSIVVRMKELIGYDETAITDAILNDAHVVALIYNPHLITGQVVDGELQPMPEDTFSKALESLEIAKSKLTYPMVIICDLLSQVLSEIKQFKR